MTQKTSYLVELSSLKFDETDDETYQSWIQAMPLNKYMHPAYGEINITEERAQRFADSINNKVRDLDADIDYDHKEYNGEAAGWVKAAEVRPGAGLWIMVEWTKKAYELIKAKAYRYFSPEFDDEWKHPVSGVVFKDVLFGGGITNRPFLKGILPLNLSEYSGGKYFEEKKNMTPEQIAQMASALGLGEDATAEMVFGAFVSKNSHVESDASTDETDADANANGANASQLVSAQLSESAATIKALSETVAKQTKALKEMEVASKLVKLNETAKAAGKLLTPVAETGIAKLLSEAPSQTYSDTLIKTLSDVLGSLPSAGETGSTRLGDSIDGDNDSVKKFTEGVNAIMLAEKLSYGDAAIQYAARNESGFSDYRDSSYAG